HNGLNSPCQGTVIAARQWHSGNIGTGVRGDYALRCRLDHCTEETPMAHCLVTGGAGFIGSHLTQRLLADGHHVTVLDDLSTGRRENLRDAESHPRCRFISGSITDPVALSDAVRGTELIYHLAAAVGVKLVAEDPVRTIETNIQPTENLLRLAVQGGQRFYL